MADSLALRKTGTSKATNSKLLLADFVVVLLKTLSSVSRYARDVNLCRDVSKCDRDSIYEFKNRLLRSQRKSCPCTNQSDMIANHSSNSSVETLARGQDETSMIADSVVSPVASHHYIDKNDHTGLDVEKEAAQPVLSSDGPRADEQHIQPTITAVDKPYSVFTHHEKIAIVLCATFGGMFSPITTNIYFPALDSIAADLNVSISMVNLTITTYMIFQAITPTFISAITDSLGRRPAYVVGFLIYIAANTGLGLNNTYAGLLVLRCLQSCGSSGMVTLQQAIIADVITSAERGKYMSITSITGVVAPSVAPIVGGVLSQKLGWHSCFWFLLILAGVYLLPMLFFMPETSRRLVDDGSRVPPTWNRSFFNIWKSWEKQRGVRSEGAVDVKKADPIKLRWPNPMAVLAVFVDKESAVILAVSSVVYAVFYGISSSLTVQFGQIYHLNSTLQGLLFIPQSVGSILAAITNSIFLDWNYSRYARKTGVDASKKKQINLAGFPIERVRLDTTIPMFVANSLFTIAYGWFLKYEVHIAAPIVMLVCIAYTMTVGFNSLSVLMIDVNRDRAASASAAMNLSRCLLGAGMTAVINPMILAMGLGWCFTFVALVQLCFLPGLWFCMKYGIEWRAQREAKRAAK